MAARADCLFSSTGSLGTAGQLNYSSTKAAVMPKVITAEFFRRGLADKIRCVAIAPGYVGTPMVKGMDQKALGKILEQVPIGRLVEPGEVASLIGEIYRNEALAGETFLSTAASALDLKDKTPFPEKPVTISQKMTPIHQVTGVIFLKPRFLPNRRFRKLRRPP